jgi:hypothetical protein
MGYSKQNFDLSSSGFKDYVWVHGADISSAETTNGIESTLHSRSESTRTENVIFSLSNTGDVGMFLPDGTPLSEKQKERIFRDRSEYIRGWLEKQCLDINGYVGTLIEIHMDAPSPSVITLREHNSKLKKRNR